jgi:hypothetical protein
VVQNDERDPEPLARDQTGFLEEEVFELSIPRKEQCIWDCRAGRPCGGDSMASMEHGLEDHSWGTQEEMGMVFLSAVGEEAGSRAFRQSVWCWVWQVRLEPSSSPLFKYWSRAEGSHRWPWPSLSEIGGDGALLWLL